MINVRPIAHPPPGALTSEIVERKGLGHPDSICDSLAEELSLRLSRHYVERFGAVLHHNVDKTLLVGGAAAPKFGGGEVLKPIEIFLAGRAALAYRGETIAIEDVAGEGTIAWLRDNLHALDPSRHVLLHCLVRPGSADLVELFERARKAGAVLANDTSCGVGFAPLSGLETVVYEVSRGLNAAEFRQQHPAAGEDTKVMGLRTDRNIRLTVACAMIGRFLDSMDDYLDMKEKLAAAARNIAAQHTSCDVAVAVNTADAPDASQIYLTVTGTSAEAGDDGEAGRGNRANGLITPFRPMTMESVAGKNPVSHVGKLYNLAAGLIAARIVAEIPEAAGAECFLLSQIGRPIKEPQLVDVGLHAEEGRVARLAPLASEIAAQELDRLDTMWRDLIEGKLAVGRWPFASSAS